MTSNITDLEEIKPANSQFKTKDKTSTLNEHDLKNIESCIKTFSKTETQIMEEILRHAPAIEIAFNIKIAKVIKYSKSTISRFTSKAEKIGLISKEKNKKGPRHGSILTIHSIPFELFIRLHKEVLDTNNDWYQRISIINDATPLLLNNKKEQIQKIELDSGDEVTSLTTFLSDKGKTVLKIICDLFGEQPKNNICIKANSISDQAHCSEVTVRRIINNSCKVGIFLKKTNPKGTISGTILSADAIKFARLQKIIKNFSLPNDAKHDQYQTTHDTNHDSCHETNHNQNRNYSGTNHDQLHVHSAANSPKQAVKAHHVKDTATSSIQTDTIHDQSQKPSSMIDRQIENLSILRNISEEEQKSARHLLSLTDDNFKNIWPLIYRERFGQDQIVQILKHRIAQGKTIQRIEEALYAINFELKMGTFPKVEKNICYYIFGTLRKKGYWRKPQGYLTPKEQAISNAKKAQKVDDKLTQLQEQKHKETEQKLENEAFEKWLSTQSALQLKEIDSTINLPFITERSKYHCRKTFWKKNIKMNQEHFILL